MCFNITILKDKGINYGSTMKKYESRDEEMARLAEIFISGSHVNQVQQLAEDLGEEGVHDLCTTILKGGHTVLHVLAQRQKLQALQALLQHKGSATHVLHTRNAQGRTPLHTALLHNALFSAKVLLDHGANPSEVVHRHKGTTLLHLMVSCDRPHALMLLLREGADPNARDLQGRTPFHLAAILGHAAIAAILIREDRVDLNAVDGSGHTAVMLAITNNNAELARQLAEAPGVDMVGRDREGMSCLHMAVSRGQLEVARCLLRRNTANINGKEHAMGRTPLHFACSLACDAHGRITSAGHAAAKGSNDDADDREAGILDGSRPPSSKQCQGAGAGENLGDFVADSDDKKLNVPPISASLGQARNTRYQRGTSDPKKGASLNGYNRTSTPRTPRSARTPRVRTPGRTPRTSTPRAGTSSAGVNNNSGFGAPSDSIGRKTTANSTDSAASIHKPRHSISGDQVAYTPRPQSYLVTTPHQSKPSPDAERSQRPSTAPVTNNLHRHFSSAFPASLVTFRIPSATTGRESAASQRSRDSGGAAAATAVTPFNVGVIRSRLVSLLLSYDADANLMTAFRKSPLHITSMVGAADVMALLLPHVTNINVLSASNKTALHLAVERGFTSLASQLVHAGANLTMRDMAGMTPLHLAARLGHADIAHLLLKAKAHKNCCDFQQRAPLHHACMHGHTRVVELLIRAGACLDRADDDGLLPLDYLGKESASSTSAAGQKGLLIQSDPHPSTTDPAGRSTEEKQREVDTPLMPQRQRKMGMAQLARCSDVQHETYDYQKMPSPVVLCSVVAL